jgi:hypothetical protein
MKKQLTDANGQNFVQNAAVPLLIGTLLSATPNDQPSTLVLSMSDGITPEVTLHLKDNKFEGVPVAFTQNPFMLTFDVPLGAQNTHVPIPNLTPKDR